MHLLEELFLPFSHRMMVKVMAKAMVMVTVRRDLMEVVMIKI